MTNQLRWTAMAVILLAVVGCATPDGSAQWDQCKGGDGIFNEARLSACTAIIQAKDALIESDSEQGLSDAYFSRAKVYLNAGDNDRAIDDFSQTIQLQPSSSGAWLLRGMAYARKGDYDRAIADFTQALILYPGLGMAEEGLENARQAKSALAHGQVRGDARAWCDGKALTDEGSVQELQVTGCTKLIESGKLQRAALARAYFNRARAYDFQGDHNRATADFGDALRLNPKNADAYIFRGMIFWLQADYDKAVADLDRAIKLKPDSILALKYRGQSQYARGRHDLAIANFNRVIVLQPRNAEAFVARSLAHNAVHDFRSAIADADRAINLSTTSEATEAYNSRGDAHFHLRDWPSAIDDYDRALKRWPEYPLALYGRGAAKAQNGDVAGGQADMAAAQKLQADIAEVKAKLGIVPPR